MKKSSKQDNRPAFQFYYKDFLFDLQGICSLGSIGLWIIMLCRMWTSPKRGMLLQANGQKFTSKVLAKITGEKEGVIKRYLDELKDNRVYDIVDGSIVCRRMYQEWDLIRKRKEAGHYGGLSISKSEAKAKQMAEDEEEVEEEVSIKVLKICFSFNTKSWENISKEDMDGWRETYPACNVEIELKKMREWLLSNPDKKKTQYRRFITNWLSRTQDKGGTIGVIKSYLKPQKLPKFNEDTHFMCSQCLRIRPKSEREYDWRRSEICRDCKRDEGKKTPTSDGVEKKYKINSVVNGLVNKMEVNDGT